MEKFIKFQEAVSIKDLHNSLSDHRIILLRESQTTSTIQIQVLNNINNREIEQAFLPYRIKKIFDEFPYPLRSGGFNLFSFKKMFSVFK